MTFQIDPGEKSPPNSQQGSPADTPPAPATPAVKVCRRCSVQTETDGTHCPQCGTSYIKARRRIPKRVIAIVAVVVVVLAIAGLLVWKQSQDHHRQQVAATKRSEAAAASSSAEAAAAASSASQAAADAKQKADDTERALRRKMITALEASIRKDAKKDVADGVLEGPILGADCTPLGGGSSDDLTAHTGTFTCLAVTKKSADGTESGYAFSAVINWDDGSYTWHLGN